MSRSYKKHISAKSDSQTRWAKCQASKRVRRFKGLIPKGGIYKKLYCSWNIVDYKSVLFTKKDFKNWRLKEEKDIYKAMNK